MQSVLVNIATFAVIFHMTIGCQWHHGFGSSHVCHKTSNACPHEADKTEHGCTENENAHQHGEEGHGNHRHGEHGHDQNPTIADTELAGHANHDHDHSGCQDDSCLVTQDVKTTTPSAAYTIEYLGGAENDSIATASVFRISATVEFPDGLLTMSDVRAHLLLGVLTL